MTDPILVAAQLATAYAQLAASAGSREEALEYRRAAADLAGWAHDQWQADLDAAYEAGRQRSDVGGQGEPVVLEDVEVAGLVRRIASGGRIPYYMGTKVALRRPRVLHVEPTLPEGGNEPEKEEGEWP